MARSVTWRFYTDSVKKRNMISKKFAVVLVAVLMAPVFCSGSSVPLPGFDHLLQVVRSDRVCFDAEKILPLLDYVVSDHYTIEPKPQISGFDKATYAYCGYESEGGLARLLNYCYNPDIPSCAVMPSVIRLSVWKDPGGNAMTFSPSLWQRMETDAKPVVVRGGYYMQNTPDVKTGAYYGYDSDRVVILMNYKGRNALVSILKQKDVSEVGKKGFIIGNESDMDYLYTHETGLALKGLGWVKSYLYDSFSVSVFIEDKKGGDLLRCGVFKWIRAGWAGNNIVSKAQMKAGMEKYANEFQNLMGKKNLPSPEDLAEVCNTMSHFSTEEMKRRVIRIIQGLHNKCGSGLSCPRMITSADDLSDYVNSLSRAELSSALIVDYVKSWSSRFEKSGNIALKPHSGKKPEVF